MPSRYLIVLALSFLITAGCATSTQVVKNEKADIQNYGELFLIIPDKDPRGVVPKIITGFKSMGFDVKQVEPDDTLDSQGSGFIISKAGHIITNEHILGKATEARIYLDGKKYEADVIKKDKELDLAILKTRTPITTNHSVISFNKQQQYTLGETVYSLGFPLSSVLGNNIRLTNGLISSTAGLKDNEKHIQTTASVQPGNSGGPLLNDKGQLIGVISHTLRLKSGNKDDNSQTQNVNFAIKSNVALDFIQSSKEPTAINVIYNQPLKIDKAQHAVVKIKSGILPDEEENKKRFIAVLNYSSIWDIWYRFKYFALSFYDYDTQDLLFHAGTPSDIIISTEDSVIQQTLEQVKKTFNK